MIYKGTVEKKFLPEISLNRWAYGDEIVFRLSVEDRSSGCNVLRIDMSAEEFANVISGSRVNTDGGLLFVDGNIGKKKETHFALVPVNSDIWSNTGWEYFKASAEAYCENIYPGWSMDDIGSFNSHRYMRGECDTYSVILRRWV